MKRQHVDRKEVVELMTTATVPLLMAGKVDCCTSAVYHAPVLVEAGGRKPVVLNFDDYGMDTYGVNIVVNKNSLKNDPELVRAFMRATVKGWEYALSHQKEAEEIILKYSPATDPKYLSGGLAGMFPRITSEDTKKYGLLHQREDKWILAQDILLDSGESDKKLEVKNYYTNDFLPKK
jgi:ABC-type nitrate/sulfonate/bicarbonate transport system substrate-binding protein